MFGRQALWVYEKTCEACDGKTGPEILRKAVEHIEKTRKEGLVFAENASCSCCEDDGITFGRLEINLSDRCNLACPWCYARKGICRPYDRDRVRQQISWYMKHFAPKAQVPKVSIFGGEPLLEWDGLMETVDWARQTYGKVRFGIVTNATLLTPKRQEVLRAKNISVGISIDGCRAAQDAGRKYPDGSGSSEVVYENVRNWTRGRKQTRARMTISPETAHLAAESTRFLVEEMGFTTVNGILAGGVEWTDDALETYAGEVHKITDWWISKDPRPDLFYLRNIFSGLKRRQRRRLLCGAGRSIVAVGTDDLIWPCHRFVNAGMDTRWALGTIETGITNKKWHKAIQDFRVPDDLIPECETCRAQASCHMMCMFESIQESGDPFKPTAKVCKVTPMHWKEALRAKRAKASSSRNPEGLNILAVPWTNAKKGMNNLIESLKTLGHNVIVIDRANPGWEDKAIYEIELGADLYIGWQRLRPGSGERLRKILEEQRAKTLICDFGPFPHYGSVIIDPKGDNGGSQVVGALDWFQQNPRYVDRAAGSATVVEQFRGQVDTWAKQAEPPDVPKGFIFLCLQRAGDATLTLDCPTAFASPVVLARNILEEAARTNKFVVIKPHPKDSKSDFSGIPAHLLKHGVFVEKKANEPLLAWLIAHCSHMVTVNSSVIFTALVAGVRVAALGQGWFTDNEVVHEVATIEDALKRPPAPDDARRRQFLKYIFARTLSQAECGQPYNVARLLWMYGLTGGGNDQVPIIFHRCMPTLKNLIDRTAQVAPVIRNDGNWPPGRSEITLADLNRDDAVHVLYGQPFEPDIMRRLGKRPNVFFAEQGWFTQKDGFYLDEDGVNALSSIRGGLPTRASSNNGRAAKLIEKMHRRMIVGGGPDTGEGYIFVPLQVESDMQIEHFSNLPKGGRMIQEDFAEAVLKAFPDKRIVFRPHPLARHVGGKIAALPASQAHGNAEIRADGNSYQWIRNAVAVVGINSTVLIEALTFFKPVAAVGKGVFSGNGVVMECGGDLKALRKVLDYQPSEKHITAFLDLLLDRQIPAGVPYEQAERWPVYQELLAASRNVWKAAPPSGVKELVYGALCEETWRDGFPGSPEGIIKNLLRQKADGLYVIDRVFDDRLRDLAAQVRAAGLEFVLGFGIDPTRMDREMSAIEKATRISRTLAIGSSSWGEWGGSAARAEHYLRVAEEIGFTWVCPVTHRTIMHDYGGSWALRNMLGDTLCFCLCGYVIAGYAYGDPYIPHQGYLAATRGVVHTSLAGMNLHKRFNFTIERFREYLSPMRMLTGCGWQPGIDAGIRHYTRKLGFKGWVSGMPFDFGRETPVVLDEPKEYPEQCGHFEQGYRWQR